MRRDREPGRLMDCATIARELGVTRAAAEAIMRRLPKVKFPDLRKIYVERADLERYLEENKLDARGFSARPS